MITHILPEVQSFSWWNLKKKEEKLAVKESFFPTSWSCIVEPAQTLTEGYSCALTSTHNLSLHFSSIESLPSVYMLEACTVHHQHLFTSEEHKHCFWIRSNMWSETTKSLNRGKKKYKKQGGGGGGGGTCWCQWRKTTPDLLQDGSKTWQELGLNSF